MAPSRNSKENLEILVSNWYENRYNQINLSANPQNLGFRFMHSLLEKTLPHTPTKKEGIRILEIGANRGEHIDFVRDEWGEYLATDVRDLQVGEINQLLTKGAKFLTADVENLPFGSDSFDRVIVTCVLHHLSDPVSALSEIRRVLKPEGIASILLPHDPGFLYRFLRNFTSVRKAAKLGLRNQLELVHAFEHRNHYLSLRMLIANEFENDIIFLKRFPFRFTSYNLNLLSVYQIQKL